MRYFDPYTNPDSYDYTQSPIEYIDAHQSQQQEYFTPVYSRPEAARSMEGEKLVVQRRSKAEALALVSSCKKWLIAGSLVGFGVFSALVAGNAVGTTAQPAAPQPTDNNNPKITSPSQGNDNGGFFQHRHDDQGGSNFGGFGSNNGSRGPVSGSSVA